MSKDKKDIKLSDKQIRFCHEYVIDWNATRAAIASGYSEKTARQLGSETLAKPYIQAYIEHIQKDLAKLAGISQLKNIQELQKIAYSSIAHLHNTWIELKDFEELTDQQRESIESIDTKTEKRTIRVNEGSDIDVETIYIKIKLYSKLQALEMINKMMGWNAPIKNDHTTLGKELPATEVKTKVIFERKT